MAKDAMAGSVNCARKHSAEAGVVNVDRPSRISTKTTSNPALDNQKAVAVPSGCAHNAAADHDRIAEAEIAFGRGKNLSHFLTLLLLKMLYQQHL
jgi:hypothetical protein